MLQHLWNITLGWSGMTAHYALLKYKQILSEFQFRIKRVLPSQYLNIKLTDISVTDPEKYPHMVRTSQECSLLKIS